MAKRKTIPKDPARFDALFRRGTELLHEGKIKLATQLLERAYRLQPTHEDAAINLGGAYILGKKFKQAVTVLQPMSQQAPDHVMVWINLGAAYLGNPVLATPEDQQKAIAAFQQALQINPAAPNVAYNLALIYRDRQETEKAVFWLQQAIETNPNDGDARRILQRLLTQP